MARTVKHTVRLSDKEQEQLQRVAKGRGYLSPSAFMRAAIRNELSGREAEISATEQRIAATLKRLSRDVFRTYRGQALLAVMDTLVKIFLTCIPRTAARLDEPIVARAREIVMTGSSKRSAKRWSAIHGRTE